MLLIESMKFAFIVHFNDFLTAGAWERDVELHLDTVSCLEGATETNIFFFLDKCSYLFFENFIIIL